MSQAFPIDTDYQEPSPRVVVARDWSVEVYRMARYHDLPIKLAYQQEIIEEHIHKGLISFTKSLSTVTFTYHALGGQDSNRASRRKR